MAAFVAWFSMMFALSPFLSFYALVAAPCAAAALGVATLWCTARLFCRAPRRLQRYSWCFWVGTSAYLLQACVVAA